jgi:hypothetical protein
MFPYSFHYFTDLGRFKYGRRVYQETFPDLRSLRGREKGAGGGGVHILQIFVNLVHPINLILVFWQLQHMSIE